jgi:sugar phosphate isomerase/epimerase
VELIFPVSGFNSFYTSAENIANQPQTGMMINRRQLLKTAGVASLFALAPGQHLNATDKKNGTFRYCLNTSTISGHKLTLAQQIAVASEAGYDGVELWVRDVQAHLNLSHTVESLRKIIDQSGLTVENAIGFAPWIVNDDETRAAGFKQMQQEMELMAALGCRRIAAPAFGFQKGEALDLFKAGERYKQLLELGRKTGVMPQLEFWGASPVLYHIGQAMMVAAVANDPDVRILADVYHMFRGQSGYDTLKMIKGQVVEIFHMNDFVDTIPREQQGDKDRVFPGDGAAPMHQILTDLKNMGGVKVLSLELFNQAYWEQDALLVAKTGLAKMKSLVETLQ